MHDSGRARGPDATSGAVHLAGAHASAGLTAFLAVEAVDVEDPVEVVGLVLEAAGEQAGPPVLHRVPVHVGAADDGLGGARRVVAQPGHGQTPLARLPQRLAGGLEYGIDHVPGDAGDVEHEDAQTHAHLGRGQADQQAQGDGDQRRDPHAEQQPAAVPFLPWLLRRPHRA